MLLGLYRWGEKRESGGGYGWRGPPVMGAGKGVQRGERGGRGWFTIFGSRERVGQLTRVYSEIGIIIQT